MSEIAKICSEGPFEIEMKVGITDGERTGTITFGLGHGKTPSPEEIQAGLIDCAKAAAAQGFRLMDRREFVQEAMGFGGIAVPGPRSFANADKWSDRGKPPPAKDA